MNVFCASRAQIVIVPVAGPDDEAALLPEPELSEPPQATTPSASAAAAARALMVFLGTALLLWWTLGPIALSDGRDPHAHGVGSAVAPAEVRDGRQLGRSQLPPGCGGGAGVEGPRRAPARSRPPPLHA